MIKLSYKVVQDVNIDELFKEYGVNNQTINACCKVALGRINNYIYFYPKEMAGFKGNKISFEKKKSHQPNFTRKHYTYTK